MIIYSLLIIPFISVFILYFFYKHLVTFWEFFLPLIITLLTVVFSKVIIENIDLYHDEYWGSLITKVEYYEKWNEYIHETCTRTVSCGENCETTETYDCSYVKNHPEEYVIHTTSGEKIYTNKNEYLRIKRIFQNENFFDLKRNYHTIDGDMYITLWDKTKEKAIPVTTKHKYKNKIKASDHSVFHYEKPTLDEKEFYGLYEYPKIYDGYKMVNILGDVSKDALEADKILGYYNGLLGVKKQVRVFILIFFEKTIEAAPYQEAYWSGGNKNEFVICIGVNKNREIKWCKPFSWTESEITKVNVKNIILNYEKLELVKIVEEVSSEINMTFIRREFKEFDYLTVEPSQKQIIISLIFVLLVNVLTCVFVIKNDYY
jgi:hypothetical protein